MGAYVNTGIFSDVWRKIKAEQKWSQFDWMVKVDPDAVFVPARLKKSLEDTYEPQGGSYYVNCPHVDYGFFGNLELFSKTAFTTLLDQIDNCKADVDTINWKVGVENGKFGPSGEDAFAQTCMDKHGVRRANFMSMTQDGPARPSGMLTMSRTRSSSHIASGPMVRRYIPSRRGLSGTSAMRRQWLRTHSRCRFPLHG